MSSVMFIGFLSLPGRHNFPVVKTSKYRSKDTTPRSIGTLGCSEPLGITGSDDANTSKHKIRDNKYLIFIKGVPVSGFVINV